MQPAGFQHAPVSKLILLAQIFAFVVQSSMSAAEQQALMLDARGLFSRGELWRLVTSQGTFSSPGEVFLGSVLLYTFRVFERQLGSPKFAFRALASSCIASSLQAAALAWRPSLRRVAPGPYGFVFAMLAHFFFLPRLIPRHFTILGVDFSDKSMSYFMALQLAAGSGWASAVPALSGVAAGLLLTCSPLRRLKMPGVINGLCGGFGALFGTDPEPTRHRVRHGPRQGRRRAPGGPRQGGNDVGEGIAAGFELPPRPSEDAVASLVQMGFAREAALEALVATQNNVQAAANRLLGGAQ
jgi:hypothetical protein